MAEKKHVLNPSNWVDKHADYLFNYAIGRVSNYHTAKDLVQETFFAGLKAADNFKGEASERTWLIAILKRKIIDYYRKINSNKGQAEVKINNLTTAENGTDWLEERVPAHWLNNAEKNIENKELGIVLKQCIENLPEKYRMVFKMKTIEDIDTKEICKELNISASNLWVIIHRARTQLQKCMENNWYKK